MAGSSTRSLMFSLSSVNSTRMAPTITWRFDATSTGDSTTTSIWRRYADSSEPWYVTTEERADQTLRQHERLVQLVLTVLHHRRLRLLLQ